MENHDQLSNTEIMTLAVYLLGGSVAAVDLEDAAIEAFRLAPKKFSWIKYEDRIDLRAVQYALRDACRPNWKYLKGSIKHGYMLTQLGLAWAEALTEREQSSTAPRKFSPSDLVEREKARLQRTRAYLKFVAGETKSITVFEFREFARVNDYFPDHIVRQRYDKIENAIQSDDGLKELWAYLKSRFIEGQ